MIGAKRPLFAARPDRNPSPSDVANAGTGWLLSEHEWGML